MFKGFSFRGRLLLWIMPILIVGLFMLSFGTYWYVSSMIEKEFTQNMLTTTGKTAEGINTWLTTLILEPESIATTPAAKAINTDFRQIDALNISRHKNLHEEYPDIFQDIYAANKNGEYHTVHEENGTYSMFVGSIANREYFKSIIAGGPAQITPPLVSRTTGIPTIFIVAPIKDEAGHPQGLIGAGISLNYVRGVAERLKAYKSGYGIVMGRDGKLIYHPNKALVMTKELTEFEDQSVRELGKLMAAGGSGIFRYTYNGLKKMAFYQPIPITGWSVATVVPITELFASARQLLWVMAGITLLLSIAVGGVIFMAANRLTQPLKHLASHAQQLASGNLDPGTLVVKHQDEIGSLAETFNVMTGNLKESMEGLRQSENKFRSLIENINVGIYRNIFVPYNRFIQVNPAMVRMFGYESEAEMLKLKIDDTYFEADQRSLISNEVQKNGFIKDKEVCFLKKDGTPIWCSVSANAEYDEQGGIKWINGFVEETTERKKLAEQLRQSQKMEAIGTLAGGIAHDFNNMLAPIYVYSEMIRKKFTEDNIVHRHASGILTAAGKAKDMVSQLLSFSRKQILAKHLYDLNEIISEFSDILQHTIRESVLINLNLSHHPCPVKADRTQIEQTLLNLTVNAQDAITGNGSITIETGQVMLDDEYCQLHPGAQSGRYVMLTVSDNGSGMDNDTLSHVFEPFFSTKSVGKGSGLGLSTVYGIIKQHDGFIDIKSTPGAGTIFRIYVPFETGFEQQLVLQPLHAETHTSQGNATILLVEDNEMVMEMTRELLENNGYTVISAYLPEDALTFAQNHQDTINLLLTDVVMPQMNGPELHRHLKKLIPGLPVLYISGYHGNVEVSNGTYEEEAICITKPFTAETLLNGVMKQLS